MSSIQLIIGLEIHVELATRTKMFSRVANVAHPDYYDAPPNTLVDPIIAGLPGALPVMNRRAVEMSMMVGLALGCQIADRAVWDRKNYFYPDLPKGYQISQYELPICGRGDVEIELPDGTTRSIGITRAHLEEDAGKLGHELPGGAPYDGSLVDLNRAGAPLLEIVTEPDFRTADEVVIFAQDLRNICRFLEVSEGIMQRGHMRFEPNINLRIETDDGEVVHTPIVEVKNLNSFRSLRGAIEHEATRQLAAWQNDGLVMGPGTKTTRGWDDARQITVLQRGKEDAHDYRYFPDPDLVPVLVDAAWRDGIATDIPGLPTQRRRRFVAELGIDSKDAAALTEDRDLCLFFEACVDAAAAARAPDVAKCLLNAGAKRANEIGTTIASLGISPDQLAGLVALRADGEIGSSAADELFVLLCDSDRSARDEADAADLLTVRDEAQVDAWVADALAREPDSAADFKAGKDAAVGRLIGAVMKASGGQADASTVRRKLAEWRDG